MPSQMPWVHLLESRQLVRIIKQVKGASLGWTRLPRSGASAALPTSKPGFEMVEKIRQRAPGAGKPTTDGVTVVERRNVMIDPPGLEVLEKIGGGNLSLGVREAARRLKESGDTTKFSKKRHDGRQKGLQTSN